MKSSEEIINEWETKQEIVKIFNVKIKILEDDKLSIFKKNDVIYEIETDQPFGILLSLGKRTFADLSKEFRQTPIRGFLKNIYNYGGRFEIEIQRNK